MDSMKDPFFDPGLIADGLDKEGIFLIGFPVVRREKNPYNRQCIGFSEQKKREKRHEWTEADPVERVCRGQGIL